MEYSVCQRPKYKSPEEKEMLKLFSKNPKKRDYDKIKEVCRHLKKVKFFSQRNIPSEGYTLLVESMEHVYCPKGKLVYKEGEPVECLYILLIGNATICISEEFDENIEVKRLRKITDKSHTCIKKSDQEFLNQKYQFIRLKQGDALGSNALMNNTPANESIYCSSNCHFASLSRSRFEEVFRKIEEERNNEWRRFFKSMTIFEHLTLRSIEKLFYFCDLKVFKRNQKVFSEGDECKGFYIIYQGVAQITKEIQVSKKSKRKTSRKKILYLSSPDARREKFFANSKGLNTKVIKIKTISEGQFIGIEDSFIKYSKYSKETHSYNAVCQSAELQCFYFTKEKAYDKLCSLNCLNQIMDKAKLNRNRMEELFFNSFSISKRIEFREQESTEPKNNELLSPLRDSLEKVALGAISKSNCIKKPESQKRQKNFQSQQPKKFISGPDIQKPTSRRLLFKKNDKEYNPHLRISNNSDICATHSTISSMNRTHVTTEKKCISSPTSARGMSARTKIKRTIDILHSLETKDPENGRNRRLLSSFYPAGHTQRPKNTQEALGPYLGERPRSPMAQSHIQTMTPNKKLFRKIKLNKSSLDTTSFKEDKPKKLIENLSFKLKSPRCVFPDKEDNTLMRKNLRMRVNFKRHFMPVACSIPSKMTSTSSKRRSALPLSTGRKWVC
ncbi:unnamed protein product [Moneuplotes crassus]|uniref:Cyclic nucleotide-binding domain-containing protein n=1 Tax=Euplotes crassus TaxID=5936 RepID=A0AAD1Y8W0_EUPCR|nr:unnamed protein product [Moneuplotes crassus]